MQQVLRYIAFNTYFTKHANNITPHISSVNNITR